MATKELLAELVRTEEIAGFSTDAHTAVFHRIATVYVRPEHLLDRDMETIVRGVALDLRRRETSYQSAVLQEMAKSPVLHEAIPKWHESPRNAVMHRLLCDKGEPLVLVVRYAVDSRSGARKLADPTPIRFFRPDELSPDQRAAFDAHIQKQKETATS